MLVVQPVILWEGFSDDHWLGMFRSLGATCIITTSQPWWDDDIRSLFLFIPSVPLVLILISFITSKAGGENSTHAHCCSCKKMHELMGPHRGTPGCILVREDTIVRGDSIPREYNILSTS